MAAVRRFRFHRHQLDRADGSAAATDADVLDLGVQDTGTDGAAWALAVRGARSAGPDDLLLAWTLRGAPHAYRRADAAAVALATAPWSDADAAKRIFDAVKPLKAAGRPALDALRHVAAAERRIVRRSMVKGDLSGRLNAELDEPYQRFCRPCDTVHIYEQPFRLAALQAGLELEPGTSPPVLRRIPGFRPPMFPVDATVDPRVDVLRGYLRFYGPGRPQDAAAFVDTIVKEVKAHWPDDTVPVRVTGLPDAPATLDLLAADVDDLLATPLEGPGVVRLVGGYDPYLQLRGRELLVPDPARQKQVWPVLGRPGAVLLDGDVIGTWRPKATSRTFTLRLDQWMPLPRAVGDAVEAEAARLAAHRGLEPGGVVVEG